MRVMLGSDEHDPHADPPSSPAEPADVGEPAAPAPKLPTHAIIDGHVHPVVSIEAATHPMHVHSHRVQFACGLAFDARAGQFEAHAVTGSIDDARKPRPSHAEVAATKRIADAAAQKLADIRDVYYPKRDEWDEHRRVHLDTIAMVKTFDQALEVGIPLRMEVYKEWLNRIGTTAEKLAELKPEWDKHRTAEEAATVEHAKACAEHHAKRAKHDGPDQRWITSDTDVTTCPNCKAVTP